jgi:DNA replication ATP-dependent helicase Dna2
MLGQEEFLWSPRYGLTGRVDASIRVHSNQETSVVPLNIKFSRFPRKDQESFFKGPSLDDRANIQLLSLLVSERYGTPSGNGLLYYLDVPALNAVSWTRSEIRDVFVMRNLIASYARSLSTRPREIDMEDFASRLPQVSWDLEECKHCFSADLCLVYERVGSLHFLFRKAL